VLCPYFGDDQGGRNPREVLAYYRKCSEDSSNAPYSHRNVPGGINETGARDLVVASLPCNQESEKEMGACKLVPIFRHIHDNCRVWLNCAPWLHVKEKTAELLLSSRIPYSKDWSDGYRARYLVLFVSVLFSTKLSCLLYCYSS